MSKVFSVQSRRRVSTFHSSVRQPDLSAAQCASVSQERRCRVCPASVTHLSRRNVPLISTSSRRLSDSREEGRGLGEWSARRAAAARSRGHTGWSGCPGAWWRRAAAIMSRHCGNVRSKVPVKRGATRRQLVEHERHKISAAIRCVLWGPEPAMHHGRAAGVRQRLDHVWKNRSDIISPQEFQFLFVLLRPSMSWTRIHRFSLTSCNSERKIQMGTFCVLPYLCSLLHSSNNSQWSLLVIRHCQPYRAVGSQLGSSSYGWCQKG